MTVSPSELLYEIKALRADIEALPDRIISAASKKIDQEIMRVCWFLIAVGLVQGLWKGQWVPVAWGIGAIALYLLSKWVSRKWGK